MRKIQIAYRDKMVILSGLTLNSPPPSSVLDSARAEVWKINVYKLGMDANGNIGLGLLPMKSVLFLD